MSVGSQDLVKGCPEAIVAEPGVGHDEQWSAVGMVEFEEHLEGLIEFGLKRELFLADPDLLFLEHLLWLIESGSQREASPAALDFCKEPCSDEILSPWVTGLVTFGCVIEEAVAGEYFLSGLRVDTIIESDKESTVCKWRWDGVSDRVPESVPWDFG